MWTSASSLPHSTGDKSAKIAAGRWGSSSTTCHSHGKLQEHVDQRLAGRLRVHHTFSRVAKTAAPPAARRGGGAVFASTGAGRIDDALAAAMLPVPSDADVFILVCGTDGFVGYMAGPVERVYDAAGKKSKVQGPTLGVLGRLGFRPEQVFKL